MHTKTLKSIDGCVTIAKCKLDGFEKVVFESGGNTGTALTEYGRRAGLETYFFVPEENLSLLNSKAFEQDRVHLVAVSEPGLVKEAVRLFEKLNGLQHIPQTAWRYEASMFRGFFILEHMMKTERFDWLAQTISAAFGPIGIYRVLNTFGGAMETLPRFLGIQQEANCPMYRAWKSKDDITDQHDKQGTRQLLSRVMYDVKPHTHGTYSELKSLLLSTNGDLTIINHAEFEKLVKPAPGKEVFDLLKDNGIHITVKDGEVVEKTGLIALAGTLKEIARGRIARGNKVLCCLTSGISEADGKATPQYRISHLDEVRDLV
jgi:threonine synthase